MRDLTLCARCTRMLAAVLHVQRADPLNQPFQRMCRILPPVFLSSKSPCESSGFYPMNLIFVTELI